MDFRINDQKRRSNILYDRSMEDLNNDYKSKRCYSFGFHYKTSFMAALFSLVLTVGLIMMIIYVALQSEYFSPNHSDPLACEEESPLSQITLTVNPETKSATLNAKKYDLLQWKNFYNTLDDNSEINRKKRQIPLVGHIPDCRGRQEECKIVLDGMKGITGAAYKRMDRLQKALIDRGYLSKTDSKDAKFRKIMECLQCRNAINPHQEAETNDVDGVFPSPFGRNDNDHIRELLPLFESRVYSDGNDFAGSEEEERNLGEERSDRVPKTPVLNKQIMESVYNRSKYTDQAKITEMIHNTTIVENEPATRKYMFHHRPVEIPDIAREESQVTRNMEPTPIILPTVETTKTSQQIQFTPQGSWPSVPVCFYGPPSSSNSYQPKPGSPFFGPYGQQPGKFYSPNNPPPPFGNPNFPFPGSSSPSSPQFPMSMMNQMGPMRPGQPNPGNLPYYCTFVPPDYQQQFLSMPNVVQFPPDFVGKPQESSAPVKSPEKSFQRQFPNAAQFPPGFVGRPGNFEPQRGAEQPEAKDTYDESDEKYRVKQCNGFWCSPPYKKCIRWDQRCDGRVDCIGAEDEIDCPYVGYYSRLHQSYNNDVPPLEQLLLNREAAPAAKQDDRQQQQRPAISQWSRDNPRTYVTNAVIYATNPPPFTETMASHADVETTTARIIVPDMPEHFACKRIIQTIPLEKRCDNVFDCEDTSDEEDCTCKDYLKHQYPSAVCDGRVDCYDGSDEEGCDFCKENQYHCYRSGTCIPKRKRCDQTMDCRLNEDELDCFALTNGQEINLDLDKRPHLNLEGVLTRYDNGAWLPMCFKSEYRNEAKRANAGQKICEYLGFRNLDSAEEVMVQPKKLAENRESYKTPVPYEYPPHFVPSKREANNNKTCFGLYVRCKPILDRKVNVHLKVDPKTKERTYQWPWEASVFVDGKYHCSAVLLENNLLLSNSKCGEGIDLNKNYTTALLGVPSPDLPFNSPYQQQSQIVDIKPVKNSDASLFRLKDKVNMTRYVQPLYLEKRIFPANKDDTCVALGVNDKHERKMKFLQPVLDNCPKCHRCYIEKNDDTSSCSKINETVNWNGNVVCLSNGGWYPAAVFQDKDESCGFANKQILNSIDYIHAHLSQAIDEKVDPIEEPTCEGIRCSLGECIRWDRICDGVRDCQDGVDESPQYCSKMKDRCENDVLECKCSKAQLRCGNGKCVAKEMFCDGKTDCEDGSDEPANCNCAEYLQMTDPKRVCDGRRHCLDKSDESYQNCLCKDSSFKCAKSMYNGTVACIPQDFVCDGEVDCPHGEDEEQSVCWSIKTEARQPVGKGEVMRRAFGTLQSVCLPRPLESQREVTNMCTKLGYTSGMMVDQSMPVEAQFEPRNDFYMFQLNSYTWMTMRDDVSFGVWKKPSIPCKRVFVHCF